MVDQSNISMATEAKKNLTAEQSILSMATKVPEIVDIPDTVDSDDEVSIIYATPLPAKKSNAVVSIEEYRPHNHKRVIDDLSRNSSYLDYDHDDDDVKVLYSFHTTRKRFFKGECSNSKRSNTKTAIKNNIDNTKSSIPLTFICEICADEKTNPEIFRISGCDHVYCSGCMGKYIAAKLHGNISAINCPVSGCRGFLEPHHCRSILPKQVFDRWGDVLCEAVILASEKFYCPFKDCSALLVDEMRGKKEVIVQSECPSCNRLFCAQCKVPWHSGVGCSEFQKMNEDERSNEDIMLVNLAKSKRWMRCPNCRIYVEKISGCLTINCRCGRIFNYNHSGLF